MVFYVQAYETSQYVVPRRGIFLGKWRTLSQAVPTAK
jgi:hypothetical protein